MKGRQEGNNRRWKGDRKERREYGREIGSKLKRMDGSQKGRRP